MIEVGMLFGAPLVGNVRLFVRLICRLCPVGTVITTGDQPAAVGLALAHVAVEVTGAPQV
jgi:hypothetical protein